LTRNAIAAWPKGGFPFDDVMDNDGYQAGPIPWAEAKELPGKVTMRMQKGGVIRRGQAAGEARGGADAAGRCSDGTRPRMGR
jgi:hypothetical protein